jgi:hypothetical protein
LPDNNISNEVKKIKNTSTAIIVIFSDPKLAEPLDGWRWVIFRPGAPNTSLNNNNNIGMWNYSETPDPLGTGQSRITLYCQPPTTISNLNDLEQDISVVAKSKEDINIDKGTKLWIYEYNLNAIY